MRTRFLIKVMRICHENLPRLALRLSKASIMSLLGSFVSLRGSKMSLHSFRLFTLMRLSIRRNTDFSKDQHPVPKWSRSNGSGSTTLCGGKKVYVQNEWALEQTTEWALERADHLVNAMWDELSLCNKLSSIELRHHSLQHLHQGFLVTKLVSE